jgi:hypothetical protein
MSGQPPPDQLLSVPAPGRSPHTACAERWNHSVTDAPHLELQLPVGQPSYCPGALTFKLCRRPTFSTQIAMVLPPRGVSVALSRSSPCSR